MIAGIVCEYNPFHKGHLYHIEMTKKAGADFIVCVMSGNFVQRGECAFFDKWVRAEAAIRCGADVVIDLPVPWSCGSAESFARGAVGLLCDFGIDLLSFGSETEDKGLLKRCADALDDGKIGELIRKFTSSGMSYPAALSEVVKSEYGEAAAKVLAAPNSTLAVEYIRALKRFSPETEILPIKRKGSGHDSETVTEDIASASKIRDFEVFDDAEKYIPEKAYELFVSQINKGNGPCRMEKGTVGILSALRDMKKEDYSLYVTDEAGLAQRIYESVKTAGSLDELYDNAKSRNYTHSRVRREVLALYLKIEKELAKSKAPYMRILSVSERGLTLLSDAKKHSSVPLVTRHSETLSFEGDAAKVYSLQCSSSDKFALFSENIRECSLEQKHSIIKVTAD